jgi:hypothetical protein
MQQRDALRQLAFGGDLLVVLLTVSGKIFQLRVKINEIITKSKQNLSK